MIMGESFYKDPLWVQELQNDCYLTALFFPFNMARTLYRNAEQILNVETQLGQDCKNINTIYHSSFERFHDAIAAKFRYENRNDFEKLLPSMLVGWSDDQYVMLRWYNFCRDQIEQLFDEDKSLPRQIIIAATYRDPDERGKKADVFIDIISDSMYSAIEEKEKRIRYKNLKMREDSEDSELDVSGRMYTHSEP